MIKPLEKVFVEEKADGIQMFRFPNNLELMNKINEIVESINDLDKYKEQSRINDQKNRINRLIADCKSY